MKLLPTFNASKGHAQLDAFLNDIKTRAIPRAVNTLLDQAQTAGFREISSTYDIPAGTMSGYAETRSATAQEPSGRIVVKGKGFPLSLFSPVQTKLGVSVKIKGKRQLIEHTFMPAKFGGRRVFGRGRYGRT